MANLLTIKQRFGIIGRSPLLDRALNTAVQVASTDLTVLITGESGVGKEVFSKIGIDAKPSMNLFTEFSSFSSAFISKIKPHYNNHENQCIESGTLPLTWNEYANSRIRKFFFDKYGSCDIVSIFENLVK